MNTKKHPFEVLNYNMSENGLYIQLLSNQDQSIYYYYETFGSVDVRDVHGEWIGGDVYDEIYKFVVENSNVLIDLFNGTV